MLWHVLMNPIVTYVFIALRCNNEVLATISLKCAERQLDSLQCIVYVPCSIELIQILPSIA